MTNRPIPSPTRFSSSPSRRTPGARRSLAMIAVALAALAMAPAPATAQSACGAGYTVKTGDSLLEIATRCGVTIPALLAANPAVRDRMELEVGDRLRIPPMDAPQPSPQQACGVSYTIRTGDTLAEIAEKCGLTIPLLVAANGPLPDPLGVHAGMRIRIPDLPATAVRDPATVAVGPWPAVAAAAAAPVSGEAAVEAEVEAEAEAESAEAAEMMRVEGVLVAGERCPLVRADDGATVALAGEISDAFRPGDRVVVQGLEVTADACGHAPAVEVRIVYRGRQP